MPCLSISAKQQDGRGPVSFLNLNGFDSWSGWEN